MSKFAYVDAGGILHITDDLAMAIKYCATGSVVQTNAMSSGYYPLDSHGNVVVMYAANTALNNTTITPALENLYNKCKINKR